MHTVNNARSPPSTPAPSPNRAGITANQQDKAQSPPSHPSIASLTSTNVPGSSDGSRPAHDHVSRKKGCEICMENFGEDQFPFRCYKCLRKKFCISCIKEWFLLSCMDPSNIPVRCCVPIPVALVDDLLSIEEVEYYKSKFVEHSTQNPLYCPNPTCSTFIPPRLFYDPKKASPVPQAEALIDNYDCGYPMQVDTPRLVGNVTCPTCQALVCLSCRSSHENFLEATTGEILEKEDFKRCPECAIGIQKIGGCDLVVCRCGTCFCWECLQLNNFCICSRQYEGADETGEIDVDENGNSHDTKDALGSAVSEGGWNWGWRCEHKWTAPNVFFPREGQECYRCVETIKFADPAETDANSPTRSEDMVESSPAIDKEEPLEPRPDRTPWECKYCSMLICGDCKVAEG
ncbi:RING finger protein [Drepanopeziza brunnea f. sp. 'multigermtubi' MB_m1]|uniref:RING finger protein n=1 Tax=Marssonina brunnea f. sp. multigermtubi (strain MB_m1) TaxID=1072389 RepID=K1WAW6_MARBU|nr:RING finger protein [Drepanopeziza brunnea f. sp. 'multigermtubi' MB_m1]EKD14435.1 RING finger protein [Drepanopeziza brunnea f. sp. 'multigermtubi' MB_m1]